MLQSYCSGNDAGGRGCDAANDHEEHHDAGRVRAPVPPRIRRLHPGDCRARAQGKRIRNGRFVKGRVSLTHCDFFL